MLVISLLGLTWISSIPYLYESSMLLSPKDQEKDASLGSASSGGSGLELPSIGGIMSLANGATLETNIAIELMKSKSFLNKFIAKNSFEDELGAVISWDSKLNILNFKDAYNPTTDAWSININDEVFRWYLIKDFLDDLNISFSRSTGLVRVQFEHESPHIAKEILTSLIDEVNLTLKERRLMFLQQNIVNLEKKLAENLSMELSTRLNYVLSQQYRAKFLAEASDEFMFLKIDEPLVAQERIYPRKTFLMLAILIVGFVLNIILIVLYGILFKKME